MNSYVLEFEFFSCMNLKKDMKLGECNTDRVLLNDHAIGSERGKFRPFG